MSANSRKALLLVGRDVRGHAVGSADRWQDPVSGQGRIVPENMNKATGVWQRGSQSEPVGTVGPNKRGIWLLTDESSVTILTLFRVWIQLNSHNRGMLGFLF